MLRLIFIVFISTTWIICEQYYRKREQKPLREVKKFTRKIKQLTVSFIPLSIYSHPPRISANKIAFSRIVCHSKLRETQSKFRAKRNRPNSFSDGLVGRQSDARASIDATSRVGRLYLGENRWMAIPPFERREEETRFGNFPRLKRASELTRRPEQLYLHVFTIEFTNVG